MALGIGGASDRITVILTGDAKGLIRELDQVGKKADTNLTAADQKMSRFADGAIRAGTVMVGAGVAIGVGLAHTVKAAEESEAAQVRLQNTLRRIPELAGTTVAAFNKQSSALQKVTAASDEEITVAQAMLGTFHLTEQQILRITPLVVDYARKFGVDMQSAAVQVGKALDGQVGALKRNGVSIDEVAFKADRYGAVTKALREQVGGFARSEGKTFQGQLTILKNQFGELEESVGRGVIGVFNDVLPVVNKVGGAIGSFDEKTGNAVGRIATIGAATTTAVGGVLILAGGVAKLTRELQTGGTLAGGFGTAVKGIGIAGGAVAGITALVGGLQALTHALGVAQTAAEEAADASRKRTPKLIADTLREATENNRATDFIIDSYRRRARAGDDYARAQIKQAEANRTYLREFRELAQNSFGTAQRLVAGLKNNQEAARAAGVDIDKLTKILKDEASAQNRSTSDTERGTQALQGHAAAVKEDSKTLESRRTALLATFSSQLAAAQSENALAQAVKDNADPLDKQAALLSAAGDKAQWLADQQQTLTGKTATAAEKQEFFRQALVELGARFPALQGLLAIYLGQLGSIPPAKSTKVTADTSQANSALDNLNVRLAHLVAGAFKITLQGIGGRASGGPVSARHTYLVGEQGPEIFVPKTGGTILNARDSAARLRDISNGGTSSPVYNITVSGLVGGAEAGRQVVDAIRAYERGSGARWRQ